VKRWFFSYVQVYQRGVLRLGHNVYEGDEHPLAKVRRWTATHGKQDGFEVIVLSFCEVGPEVPECDDLTWAIPG
jgi:hypothetical protein